MKITILDTKKLENVPSGSGIVKSGDIYYVIGDDSPFLFSLDQEFNIISKTNLVESSHFLEGRIIKVEKPDFESMEMIGENELVIFGSGSKSPQRDIFIRVLLNDTIVIENYDISEFYTLLKSLAFFKDSEFNIEATAFYNNHLFLFNRKKNLIIKFTYSDFLAFIKKEVTFPKLEIIEFYLPKINGVEAGFSGATTLKDKIIFTASVEDTDNAYDDGEILGSIIGMIDISNNIISQSFEYCLIPKTDENLKVESITVKEEVTTGKTKLVLITDDDKGNSIIIDTLLFW